MRVLALAERMALAARVSGHAEERRFWAHLPATLMVSLPGGT